MKKYGFAYALVFAFISVSAWGGGNGGSDGGSIVPRGNSPDQALRAYVQAQMDQMVGDGYGEIDYDDPAPDDFLIRVRQFRDRIEQRVDGMGQLNATGLLNLAEDLHIGRFVARVLELLESELATSVDYTLFICQLDEEASSFNR